jgi:hypothetical protein
LTTADFPFLRPFAFLGDFLVLAIIISVLRINLILLATRSRYNLVDVRDNGQWRVGDIPKCWHGVRRACSRRS